MGETARKPREEHFIAVRALPVEEGNRALELVPTEPGIHDVSDGGGVSHYARQLDGSVLYLGMHDPTRCLLHTWEDGRLTKKNRTLKELQVIVLKNEMSIHSALVWLVHGNTVVTIRGVPINPKEIAHDEPGVYEMDRCQPNPWNALLLPDGTAYYIGPNEAYDRLLRDEEAGTWFNVERIFVETPPKKLIKKRWLNWVLYGTV